MKDATTDVDIIIGVISIIGMAVAPPLEDMSTNWRVIHTTLQNMTKQDNAALQNYIRTTAFVHCYH